VIGNSPVLQGDENARRKSLYTELNLLDSGLSLVLDLPSDWSQQIYW
jgi:hypothetical protein